MADNQFRKRAPDFNAQLYKNKTFDRKGTLKGKKYFKCFFPIFVLACALTYLFPLIFSEYIPGYKSDNWPITKSKIIQIDFEDIKNSKTPGVSKIEYLYMISEAEYINNRFGFFQFMDSEKIITFIKNHSEGELIDIYYNPDNPGESCIFSGMTWFGKLFLPGYLGGLILFVLLTLKTYKEFKKIT
ncbi:MAG: DUF3592 domain-containing protein [Desulfobacteraceae bacterium]|nr:DUF3592 domain-containing protein [Desulfobacteraceae bacterium]